MESGESPPKAFDIGGKTSIVCSNMPESLLETNAAKKHFGQFGRVKKILLRPKRQGCVVEYDTRMSAEKALLNAGAYDGFVFDVTWNRKKKSTSKTVEATPNKRTAKEDDPDWMPDSDVEEELSAMSTVPVSRQLRQKSMEQDLPPQNIVRRVQSGRATVSKIAAKFRSSAGMKVQAAVATEALPVLTTAASMTTSEAAAELHQLRSRVSRTADEQRRTLDARDRILRAWGGTGSRVRAGGATIGTCPDLCPEKERLQRQVEHQVHILECDASGGMSACRAVKQYSRSSADQETPMCYELRPPRVLAATMAYLLHEVADCTDSAQISLAEWFQFMWDRLRSIRKDITQQALCCAESVRLVEQCARFHAHCAARLADLEHSQFDQRLNTDNLTKCLQTLKHMYADLPPSSKPREAEFRAYIALLNLGDANFIWEVKQLSQEIQKSADITFAVQVFTALDNNNYVRFFRLVRDKATYLQACILLRYFNDVRARGLARIVKAFAPRGGSKYPIRDLMENLGFEDEESLKLFVIHYGLKISKHEDEIDGSSVILDRNQFIEDSDPYPIARAVNLIESKRCCSVGEIIAGSPLPDRSVYRNHTVYCSFNEYGSLKEASLLAEDLGYDTKNETNKDLNELKRELSRAPTLSSIAASKSSEPKSNVFGKPDAKAAFIPKSSVFPVQETASYDKNAMQSQFSFNPSIPIVSTEVFKSSPEKLFSSDNKITFAFSKPDDNKGNTWGTRLNVTSKPSGTNRSIFGSKSEHVEASKKEGASAVFGKPISPATRTQEHGATSVFGETTTGSQNLFKTMSSGVNPSGIFGSRASKNIFAQASAPQSLFGQKSSEVFKAVDSTSIFGQKTDTVKTTQRTFAPSVSQAEAKAIFGDMSNKQVSVAELEIKPSPKSLFANAASREIGSTQNPSLPENKVFNAAFGPLAKPSTVIVEGEQQKEQRLQEELHRQQQQLDERRRFEEAKRLEEQRQQELRRQEELRMEEIRRQDELRKREEEKRRQEELMRRLEEERRQAEIRRLAEEKRRAEEEQRKTEERNRLLALIEKESQELVEELTNEITLECVQDSTAREIEQLKILVECARDMTNTLIQEVTDEIIEAEVAAEKLLSERLMAKYAEIWRTNTARNTKRRKLVDGTPVWLSDRNPQQAAEMLRRNVLRAALNKMNDIHRGNIFSGKPKPEPKLEPYNIMEVVRTSLLKGLKRVKINYHSCFFWKVTLSSPGRGRWLNKRVDLHQWILRKFSDNENVEKYPHCTYLKKDSWNNLMNFAISVCCSDSSVVTSLEGSNGLLFYSDENDTGLMFRIKDQLQRKRNKQTIPVVVITPDNGVSNVQEMLRSLAMIKVISDFKIIVLDSKNTHYALDKSTKTALKWLARNVPDVPPLEMDLLKSVLLRCVGMEFWYRLNLERHTAMDYIFKDANKLVEFYNTALEKLRRVVTDASIFEYTCFPNELKQYLQESAVLPKTYEFFPDDWLNEHNMKEITKTFHSLRLQPLKSPLDPVDPVDLQKQVQRFCDEIDWFENPGNVSCKIISHLPRELSDEDVSSANFSQLFEQYDFLNMISIAVVEKINSMRELDGKYVIYDRAALTNVRTSHWWYETRLMSAVKHRAIDYATDDIDDALNESFSRNVKRMRLDDSDELMELDDKDESLVEQSINNWSNELKKLTSCNTAMNELEKLLDKEAAKTSNLEEILRAALHD